MLYDKPALTFEEQAKLLQSRGLQIDDFNHTVSVLSRISYYRLSAYTIPFRKKTADGIITDYFHTGVSCDQILKLYKFDQQLRTLLFYYISEIEISLRTTVVYHLSHKYGAHWHDCNNLYKENSQVNVYDILQRHATEQLLHSQEEFIIHYKKKYDTPKNPPAWMLIETMTWSHLSFICGFLKNRQDIAPIAKTYKLPIKVFRSWIRSLNTIRNICAHHARLWNRELGTSPEIMKKNPLIGDTPWLDNIDGIQNKRVYYTLCIIAFFMHTLNKREEFICEVRKLINSYPDLLLSDMGFVDEWQNESIWQ